MGGNLFEDNRRINRDEYDQFEPLIVDKLRKIFLGIPLQSIPAYREKSSFGDLDILISKSRENDDFDLIRNHLEPDKIASHGSGISFQLMNFQIDLIFAGRDDYHTSLNYFSWNDLGNLMGRLYHKTGFKYGHRGLSFIIKVGDYQFSEIVVSKDQKLILEFVGYDYEKFQQGFDSIEDIFKFASNTPYFNKKIYLLDNRSHKSRIRDSKREIYRKFLEWTESKSDLPEFPWKSFDERGGYRQDDQWLEKAFLTFPGFKEEYLQKSEEFKKNLLFKKKFNGDLVRDITGLEGKELGEFMRKIKDDSFYNNHNFKEVIIQYSEEEISEMIQFMKSRFDKEAVIDFMKSDVC